MTFENAFEAFIQGKKIISFGFYQPVKTLLANGYYAYPAGYYTDYENKCRVIFDGAVLEKAGHTGSTYFKSLWVAHC